MHVIIGGLMSITPKAEVKEIAIVLKDTPTAFCRDTKHDGVKMCFDKNLDVTRWLYKPEVFAKTYKADIEKLRQKVDDCPVCQKTSKLMELRKKDGEQQKIITDSLVTFAYTMLEDLSRQEDVEIPEVKIGTCPSKVARTKTCYIVKDDPLGMAVKKDAGRIWLHPEDIGPTAVAHEFYHYMMFQKGNEMEAYDEMKANAYAKVKVNEMFPESSEEFNSESAVFSLTGANNMLERIWSPLAKYTQGLTGQDIDNAFTPEIIARSVETAIDAVTPNQFSTILINTAIGAAYFGGTMMNQVPVKYKKTLLEMAGHHLFKAISLFNPRVLTQALAGGYDFGKALTSFDGNGIFGSLFRGFDVLGLDMQVASQTLEKIMKSSSATHPISTQVKTRYSSASPIPGLDLGISQA